MRLRTAALAPDEPTPPLLWDLTNNITFQCWKSTNHHSVLPCLLRGHRIWRIAKNRPVMGVELLLGQGFPVGKVVSSGVSERGRDLSVKVPWQSVQCEVCQQEAVFTA